MYDKVCIGMLSLKIRVCTYFWVYAVYHVCCCTVYMKNQPHGRQQRTPRTLRSRAMSTCAISIELCPSPSSGSGRTIATWEVAYDKSVHFNIIIYRPILKKKYRYQYRSMHILPFFWVCYQWVAGTWDSSRQYHVSVKQYILLPFVLVDPDFLHSDWLIGVVHYRLHTLLLLSSFVEHTQSQK